MLISVICPCYNEEKYIKHILDFFLSAKPDDKELLMVDGMSTDGTRKIIEEYSTNHHNIRLIDNPNKYVPFALNTAIKQAKGEYIARVDAHTEYPDNYFEKCYEILQKTHADNVGGYIYSKGKTNIGKAIAIAMSTKFGVGNTEFRTEAVDAYVQTVPFGFWHKSAFEKFGFFDEEMMRNQDDEFNYRTNKLGGKIYQSSQIESSYYVRDSYKAMAKQYYQYGVYKPLVFKKLNNAGMRLRHIIPGFFALYIISIPFAFLLGCFLATIWISPFILYMFLNIYFAFSQKNSMLVKLLTIPAYTLLHICYGLGMLVGIWKWRGR
ncbi:MAG: glycosyltransferase family 2 protein [Bacteroidota bacterium]|nr:glycosyltransferase family 2 protein [Bacteroidota bacterium]